MKQRLCFWPSPMLGDMLLYLSPNKRHALFLEAYTLRSLCDELSSASGISSKTVNSSCRYFDLFFLSAAFIPQLFALLNCRFQGVLIAHSMQKSTRMIISFIHNACIYIFSTIENDCFASR